MSLNYITEDDGSEHIEIIPATCFECRGRCYVLVGGKQSVCRRCWGSGYET